MNERLKQLRKALDLTQQAFADKIGVKRNTIATYETGRNTPIDAVVSLICRTFNVNESWLRTGKGDMFIKLDREDEIAMFMGKILRDETTEFKKRFINALARMDESGWIALEKVLDDIYSEND